MNLNKFFSFIYVKLFKFLPTLLNVKLAKFFKKLYDLNTQSSYGKDFLAHLEIENSKFKLWLMKDDYQAQSVYLPLHKKKIIYETAMIKALISAINKLNLKTFLDLGSFMGYYACFISKHFNENINVFAIESNSDYVKYINKSISENNFKNISVLNKILSDKSEELFIYKEGVYKSKKNLKNYTLDKSITLDEICEDQKINPEIIKIDVHGAEHKVLLGSATILNKKVKIILLELHTNQYIEKFSDGSNRKNVIEFLISNSFNCFLVSEFRTLDKKKNKFINEKLNIIEITKNNYDEIFFDRDYLDQFIFACKKDIDIKSFDCFK